MEVDSKEYHSATDADLPIVKKEMHMQGNRLQSYEHGNTMISIPCSYGGRMHDRERV